MGINQYIQIGSKIKQARICKGIRQKDMAEKLGLSVSTYSNYENNHREPEFDTIKKACFILGMTIDELIYNQPKIGGWIPCSERLPDKGVMNPITNDYAEYLCTVCVDGFRTVRPIKFDKDGCWVNHGMNFDKYVTAWQPLPEEYHG